MPGAIDDAKGVNLDNASEGDLQNRPFKSWDDLKRVEGFSETLVEDLRSAGAQIT